MNDQININPNQVRISDVGRIITSIPRALFSKIKEKWAKMKTRRQELKAEKQMRKEGLKRHREYKKKNSKIRKFFAGIINRNPKAKEKILEREASRSQETPISAPETPTPASAPVSPEPTPINIPIPPEPNPVSVSDPIAGIDPTTSPAASSPIADQPMQNVQLEDELGQPIGQVGIRVARISGNQYRLIIDRGYGQEVYGLSNNEGPTL